MNGMCRLNVQPMIDLTGYDASDITPSPELRLNFIEPVECHIMDE